MLSTPKWGLLAVAVVAFLACSSPLSDVDASRSPPKPDIDASTPTEEVGAVDARVDEPCVPSCEGKFCGSDGCLGICGNCGQGFHCETGQCLAGPCEPDCENIECGGDGCGGSCGECADGFACNQGGCLDLTCQPNCPKGECGSDGCGGTCECDPGFACENGDCVPKPCEAGCPEGKCGIDGCGDICECNPGFVCEDGDCVCEANCPVGECGFDGCGGMCVCSPGFLCENGDCVCLADCADKNCGDDGCGESCGECGEGDYCEEGICVAEGEVTIELLTLLPGYYDEGDPISMAYDVSGIAWPVEDGEVVCLLDGEPIDVGFDSDSDELTFLAARGMHTLCCFLTIGGLQLPGCAAIDCISLKVKVGCDGDDLACYDGNPCSVDACAYGYDGWECHYGTDITFPNCCQSDYDCGCTEDGWGTCDPVTASCTN